MQGLAPVRRELLTTGQINERPPEDARAHTCFADRVGEFVDRFVLRTSAQTHEYPDRHLDVPVPFKVIDDPACLKLNP